MLVQASLERKNCGMFPLQTTRPKG
uniref:Uncharacterized protein n=1 Tax=Arundo donax TaxID=35708 RepID=A0A0A8YC21_ARUDO